MDCIKDVVISERLKLFNIEETIPIPVMVNCPCPKCNDVDLSGPVISLDDLE